MSDELERDFFTSPGEHVEDGCWCGHPAPDHKWDPVRDYRELMCKECKAARDTESPEEPA